MDILNLGAAKKVGVAGKRSAAVARVGKVSDRRADAVHESDWDDLKILVPIGCNLMPSCLH